MAASPASRRPIAGRLPVAYRAVLLAAVLLAAGLLFQELVTFVLLVLAVVIVAIPLAAGADLLERFRVPRWLGTLACLLLALGVLAGIIALIVPTFVEQANLLVRGLPGFVEDLRRQFNDATGAEPSETGRQLQSYLQGLLDQPERVIAPVADLGVGVVGAVAGAIFVLVAAFYVAMNPRPLIEGALRVFPPDRRSWAERVMRRLRRAWIGWLQGVAADMAVTGVLLYIGLSLIGLEFAVVFAVVSALLVVVPYFGSIAGGIPPVLFALTESFELALLTLAVYVLVQQIESNVIIPMVMSRTVKLHPAVIAIGVLVVGQLFGIVGLFIAVPILSAFFIVVEELWVRPVEKAHHDPPPDLELEMPAGVDRPTGADPA